MANQPPKHIIEIVDLDPETEGGKAIGFRVLTRDENAGTDADYLMMSLKNTLAIIGTELHDKTPGNYPWPL